MNDLETIAWLDPTGEPEIIIDIPITECEGSFCITHAMHLKPDEAEEVADHLRNLAYQARARQDDIAVKSRGSP